MNLYDWGEQITYTQATGWYHDGKQEVSSGPYAGGIVGFEENGHGGTVIQVRADGLWGDAPIMAVDPADILT